MEREDFFRRSDHGRGETNEKRRKIDSSLDHYHQENSKEEIMSKDDKKLASTKAEMDEAKEENRKLKLYLSQIVKEYETLQTQYNQIMAETMNSQEGEGTKEENELVSLSLGRTSSRVLQSGSSSRSKEEKWKAMLMDVVDDEIQDRLSLGLECKAGNADDDDDDDDEGMAENEKECLGNDHHHESPKNSVGLDHQEVKDKELGGGAIQKDHDEEVLQQNVVKRARVSVRARCDTPTMNDGCQWRKYGQKIAKGNPCPRAYYRCTVSPSCPVRKQVQRCPQDMCILITTYEGTHNHPLPISATAMASTTSAAASMLLSGAVSSSSSPSSSAAAANLQGLNYYLSNNSSKPNSFYLPTSSFPSSSSSLPTITLDLTTSTLSNPLSSSSSSSSFSSLLKMFSSSSVTNSIHHQPSRSYTSTNLNFSSNAMDLPLEPNNTLYWGNPSGSFATYGNTNIGSTTHQLPYHHMIQTRAGFGASTRFGRSSQPFQSNDIFQSVIHKGIQLPSSNSTPSLPPEAIKAITTDPGFRSALATVLSSIVTGDRNIGGGRNGDSGQKSKPEEVLTFNDASANSTAAGQSHGCGLGSVSKLPSSSASGSRQPESMKSLLFSASRSESVSPSGTKEQSE